jgi:hypothetical protein
MFLMIQYSRCNEAAFSSRLIDRHTLITSSFLFAHNRTASNRLLEQGSPSFGEFGGVEAPSDVKRWTRSTLPLAEIEAEDTLCTGRCQVKREVV